MTVDPATGLVAWRPTISQVGEHLVILRATDISGSISLHDFNINVTAPNTAPVVVKLPAASAYVNVAYVIDVVAQDAELSQLIYSLSDAPAGASIDAATGRVSWLPAASAVGSQDFTVAITDEAGATTEATWNVDVRLSVPNLLPLNVTLPRKSAAVTRDYISRIGGTDAIGRLVDWSLSSGPTGLSVESDGTLRWTPAATMLGAQSVELQATTADGDSESVSFAIEVTGYARNSNPVIASQPTNSVALGDDFAYDVLVTDVDRDLFSFALAESPVGMSIHPSRGTIRWTPAADQLGEANVVIQVSDSSGATENQEFKLKVSRFGGPPTIMSIPPTEASLGAAFLYSVVARDAEGDPLSYTLLAAPTGMTIVNTTGEVSWTPAADQLGQQDVVIQVADGVGGASTQGFAIRVNAGVPNQAPIITSTSPRFGAVGTEFVYAMTATDPESTTITYSLGRFPDGMLVDAVTGRVTWTPAVAQVGKTVITLIATDAGGASAIESFEFDALAENQQPTINSVPPVDVAAGAPFLYDVLARDADLDQLTFEFTKAPAGATIDSFGRIRWMTEVALIGSHDFAITVSDPRGGQVSQSFTLDVIEDIVAPKLSLIESLGDGNRKIQPWSGPFVVYVRSTDNVAIASTTLQANGRDVPLDAAGTAKFTFEEWRFATIIATATAIDTNGNITTKTISFDYDVPQGWSGLPGSAEVPTAIITSPADTSSVTGMVSIIGTVAHDDFAIYKLSYRRADEDRFTEFYESTTAVSNGELGVWDTSLLLNDEYIIRLEVATNDAVVNVVEHHVGLAGDLKLGNFRLSFTDMVIPVAGIPIEITRIYDTLQADREGDFGYGWRLEYRNTDLRVGLPKSGLEDIGIYSPLRAGVKVYLNVPGQGRQGFTFNPDIRVLPGFGGNNLVLARPRFTPDRGVTSTLSTGTSSYLQVNEQGELFAPGGIPYNPASPSFGGAYVLTTRGGITYRIDGGTGELISATDQNNNRLRFTETGVFDRDNKTAVAINRDRFDRIVSISDSEQQQVSFEYTSGDLTAVVDRAGNRTKFVYDAEVSHFLYSVTDPLGREGIRQRYNNEGRLVETRTSGGQIVTFEYDLGLSQVTGTDRSGNRTVAEFDTYGNLIRDINAFGKATTYTYDVDGNQASVTNTLGHVSTRVYDSRGNLVEITDELGNAVQRAFDSRARLTQSIDPLGNTTTFSYDDNGNQVSESNPQGRVTQYRYDQNGKVVWIGDDSGSFQSLVYDDHGFLIEATDSRGRTVRYERERNGNTISTTELVGNVALDREFIIDQEGRLLSTTDSNGVKSLKGYDAVGNQISSTNAYGFESTRQFNTYNQLNQLTDEVGGELKSEYNDNGLPQRTIYTDGSILENEYDAIGRVIARYRLESICDARVLVESNQYDALGQLIATHDASGNTTRFSYNEAGQRTSIEDALGNTQTFLYDAVGRITQTTSKRGYTTTTDYDSVGNVIRQKYPDATTIRMEYDKNGNPIRMVDAAGSVVMSAYDKEGRLTSVTDANGNKTRYAYTPQDLLASTTDAAGRTTSYEYDEYGNRTRIRYHDASEETFEYTAPSQLVRSIDQGGNVTSYVYNPKGRPTEIRFHDGTSEAYTYDSRGRVLSIIDRHGETSFSYSSSGDLIATTDSNGKVVQYTHDAMGNVTSVSLNGIITAMTRNEFGQIATASDDSGGTTRYEYDADGNLVRTNFSNGIVETRSYDPLGRLVTLQQTIGSATVASYQYVLDATGRITQISEDNNRVTRYQYDATHRLIEESISKADVPLLHTMYEYDSVGNRTLKHDYLANESEVYVYDGRDRLLSRTSPSETILYGYDDSGRMILESSNINGTKTVTWNSAGQVEMVTLEDDGKSTLITYAFDVDGNLLRRTVGEVHSTYVYDRSIEYARLLAEYGPNDELVRHNTYATHLISYSQDAQIIYTNSDGQGNQRIFTDETGVIVDTIDYDAFGNTIWPLEESGLVLLYNGEARDTLVGYDLLRSRLYDSSQGRFISADYFEGVLQRPESLNRYAYVHNDPANYDDPSGQFGTAELIVGIGIIGLIAWGLGTVTESLINARGNAEVVANLVPTINEAHAVAMAISDDLWIHNAYQKYSNRKLDAYHRMHLTLWHKIAEGLTPGWTTTGFFTKRDPSVSVEAKLQISGNDDGYEILSGGAFSTLGVSNSGNLGNKGSSPLRVGFVITAMAKALSVEDYKGGLDQTFRLPKYVGPIGVYELNDIGKHGEDIANAS